MRTFTDIPHRIPLDFLMEDVKVPEIWVISLKPRDWILDPATKWLEKHNCSSAGALHFSQNFNVFDYFSFYHASFASLVFELIWIESVLLWRHIYRRVLWTHVCKCVWGSMLLCCLQLCGFLLCFRERWKRRLWRTWRSMWWKMWVSSPSQFVKELLYEGAHSFSFPIRPSCLFSSAEWTKSLRFSWRPTVTTNTRMWAWRSEMPFQLGFYEGLHVSWVFVLFSCRKSWLTCLTSPMAHRWAEGV